MEMSVGHLPSPTALRPPPPRTMGKGSTKRELRALQGEPSGSPDNERRPDRLSITHNLNADSVAKYQAKTPAEKAADQEAMAATEDDLRKLFEPGLEEFQLVPSLPDRRADSKLWARASLPDALKVLEGAWYNKVYTHTHTHTYTHHIRVKTVWDRSTLHGVRYAWRLSCGWEK